MPRSAARAATRRPRAPRSASSRSATPITAGTRSASAPEPWRLYNMRKARGESLRVFPALQLDRARRLALHPPGEHPDRAALPRGRAAGGRARRPAHHGRRRAAAAAAGRDAAAALGPLPDARLLPAHRRGRERGGDDSRHHPRDARVAHLRAPGAADRPGRRRPRWSARSRRAISDDRSTLARSGDRLRGVPRRGSSDKDVLRFIACGSVDDGKSTLIGRLLHDTKQLFDDQLAALERASRRYGTKGGARSRAPRRRACGRARAGHHDRRRLPLLLDRDAHLHRRRHARPRAIHPQHGDRRLDGRPRRAPLDARQGLTRQTRRHASSSRCSASGSVVLAINKMDLVGWSRGCLPRRSWREFAAFAARPRLRRRRRHPAFGAQRRQRRAARRSAAPWYGGPTLLQHLEQVESATRRRGAALPHAGAMGEPARTRLSAASAGLVAGGTVAGRRPGPRPALGPRDARSPASSPSTATCDRRSAGQSVTLVLADEVDVSRGDVLAAAARAGRRGCASTRGCSGSARSPSRRRGAASSSSAPRP